MFEEKMNRIEEALAHQEQQIHDLSEMVIMQGAEIDSLKNRIVRLLDKVGLLENSSAENGKTVSISEQAAQDKPPHY